MRLRTIAAVAVCLGMLGASGCGNSARSCGVADYGPTQQHGFATPRQALRSVFAVNPSLSRRGWTAASAATRAVEFRLGDDSVDVVQRTDGQWVIGAVTVCK
jgi:hypothetical protein